MTANSGNTAVLSGLHRADASPWMQKSVAVHFFPIFLVAAARELAIYPYGHLVRRRDDYQTGNLKYHACGGPSHGRFISH